MLQFEAADDRFTIGGRQPLHGGFVPLDVLAANRVIERRRLIVGHLIRKIGLVRCALVVARQIANAVHHRFAQIRLERALMTRLERVEPADGGEDRVLHKVRGFEHAARRRGHASPRPAPQRRDNPFEQPVERRGVAALNPIQEFDRLLGGQRLGPGRLAVVCRRHARYRS